MRVSKRTLWNDEVRREKIYRNYSPRKCRMREVIELEVVRRRSRCKAEARGKKAQCDIIWHVYLLTQFVIIHNLLCTHIAIGDEWVSLNCDNVSLIFDACNFYQFIDFYKIIGKSIEVSYPLQSHHTTIFTFKIDNENVIASARCNRIVHGKKCVRERKKTRRGDRELKTASSIPWPMQL